ncbi:SycD/LcrH family type III secretion system chaperone [Cupriavidus pampae]|uniref:CesD/SycD/LcrH family type III secretion system chaperone n=1 Tax=Cupriavidus pampae TaxID=659251 RepID=A0ABM8XZW5_9BURK|nr:SycD/LcrH family type III secretion system chaperone [Cupriavidus pampae]CAG9185941.1 hypothetical protein LMG32289_06172 [Cupriavidus pampae]
MQDVRQYLSAGGSLRSLFDLQASDLDTLYSAASQRYAGKDFEGARQLFFALAALDSGNLDYWLAAGMCYQKLQRHEEALGCFAQAAAVGVVDPRPSYLAGISLQLLGNQTAAREAFTVAIKCSGKQKQYSTIKSKAATALKLSTSEETH